MGTAPGLVGRQAELTQLSQILGENTGRAVTISGEAGVGKSALMAQVSAQAVAKGWLVVQVLGVEAEESFALGGLHQLVTGLKNALAELDERDRATLAPASGADLDSSVSAMELTVAVLNLLTAAAKAQPVLLVIDDVQWLDDVSATVLGAIGRRLAHQRVWILTGMRVPSRSKFISTGWIELALDPLDAESSEQLLLRSAAQLTAAGRAAVLTAAAGNPLALVELPRSVGQVQQWTAQVPLTERLVSVFGGRLEALDSSVRRELLRAALDGTTVSAQVTNHGRYEMTDVQQAVDAGLLIANPLGKNIFRHPLVRDAVIYRASARERRDAHRDLAELYLSLIHI